MDSSPGLWGVLGRIGAPYRLQVSWTAHALLLEALGRWKAPGFQPTPALSNLLRYGLLSPQEVGENGF